MKIVAIIPARYQSSRFEGKPLAMIKDKPMVWWVYNKAVQVPEITEVYVATDSEEIYNVCKKLQINVCMTDENNLTGTDRVAEVAESIPADIYLNIQGDEPLIEVEVIRQAILPLINNPDILVTNLMTEIKNPIDVVNATVPKVITNRDDFAIYLTRTATPYPKGSLKIKYYKQICVYGYRPEELSFFRAYGKTYGKAKIENIEDIELLRFIENGHSVKFIEVHSDSVAVDTPKDLERVRMIVDNSWGGG